jgi:hypothetical protein
MVCDMLVNAGSARLPVLPGGDSSAKRDLPTEAAYEKRSTKTPTSLSRYDGPLNTQI